MERVLFHLGPFPVFTFGVAIAVGFLIGLWVTINEAKRLQLDPDQILELAIFLLVGGILGARLFFILAYAPDYYLANPQDIIRINEGGLSIHGGIIGAILLGLWYTRRTKLDFWKTADVIVLGTILAQGIARIGCDVFGIPVQYPLPWGVAFNGQIVHPVQIYEMILDFGLFIILWGLRYRQTYQGQLFVYYLGGYAMIRFILEFFRTNPSLLGSITPAHLSSIVFIIIAVLLGRRLSNQESHLPFMPFVPAIWVNQKTWFSITALSVLGSILFFTFT